MWHYIDYGEIIRHIRLRCANAWRVTAGFLSCVMTYNKVSIPAVIFSLDFFYYFTYNLAVQNGTPAGFSAARINTLLKTVKK